MKELDNEIDRFGRYIFETLKTSDEFNQFGTTPNYDNLISYIVAEIDFLNFREKTRPNYKLLYVEILNNIRDRQIYVDFCEKILDYYNGEPNLDSALWALTRTYLQEVWSITDDRLNNIILLTSFSFAFMELRQATIENYRGVMIEQMIEKTNP